MKKQSHPNGIRMLRPHVLLQHIGRAADDVQHVVELADCLGKYVRSRV